MTTPTRTEKPKLIATIRLQHMITFNQLILITKPVLDLFVSVPPQPWAVWQTPDALCAACLSLLWVCLLLLSLLHVKVSLDQPHLPHTYPSVPASQFLPPPEPAAVKFLMRHDNNIPTMQLITGIFRNTLSKSYMLSLNEWVREFWNNALWDTH